MSTGGVNRTSSPDFSTLSSDELAQLEIVLQRQAHIENEQNQRLSGLRRTMLHLQQSVQNDTSKQRVLSANSSPIPTNSTILSSSDLIQCYICSSNIEIQSNSRSLSPPIVCADCHRPICRRCGNYTSPELIHIDYRNNNVKNQTHTSKWRCRMCIVRREVVRKSGMLLSQKSERKLMSLNE